MDVTWENEPWAEAYRLAVLESDQNLRDDRIQDAKRAILARIQDLSATEAESHERIALKDALVILRVRERHVA
jgi:hypothetical protein